MAESEEKKGEPGAARTRGRLQETFPLVFVVGITVLLLVMIRAFVVSVILAGVLATMTRPALVTLAEHLGGRKRLAAALTVTGVLLLLVVPLGGFLAIVVSQAVEVSDTAGPWIREQSDQWDALTAWLAALPGVGRLVPDETAILARASQAVGQLGTFLIEHLSAATTGTLNLILQLFVMLYATYFYLLDGPAILARILYFTPLDPFDQRKLIDQFVSVTRATIKGSILVGLIQGALAGAAFFALSLPGAAFWATVMAVLSVIPVLGSGIVWGPAAVILMATGRLGAGIALALWGLLIVGTIDNFLRPRLVGRDAKMHDLMVLLSTFGGLSMFGLVGFIVGPIIAALFLTAWDLFGAKFHDMLPAPPNRS